MALPNPTHRASKVAGGNVPEGDGGSGNLKAADHQRKRWVVKKSEIKVGGHYLAKVSGRVVTVRVDTVREVPNYRNGGNRAVYTSDKTVYDVTNLVTGRKTTFRSAAKFRSEVDGIRDARTNKLLPVEDEQRADPTHVTARPTVDTTTKGEITVSSASQVPSSNAPIGLATKLRPVDLTTVAGYTPTEEQAAILEAARQSGLQVLVIAAGAGAGKTSTLKMLETILPGRGQYTAFNTSLVTESKAKFQRARCNTTHSLAFGSVGRQYAHRLNGQRVFNHQLAAILGIESITVTGADPSGMTGDDGTPLSWSKTLRPGYLMTQVMEAIGKFCQSADPEISRKHFKHMDGVDNPGEYKNQDMLKEVLVEYARKAWADLSDPNGKLPIGKSMVHDTYVKVWQLGTGQSAPVIQADYILLDEAQDTAPVFLDVLRRQSALIILVGDDNQQIYEWRGAVNAMASFPGAPRRLLSQSFRFGQAIADVANSILAELDEPTDLVMRGLESIPSRAVLPQGESGRTDPADDDEYGRPMTTPCHAVLCRTNACAVGTVLSAVKDGKHPHLIGGGAETVKFVRAAQELQLGKGTGHPDLCLFNNWKEVQAYVKEDEGSDLKLMVKLIDEFRCEPIIRALENMPEERDADLVVSTAHKSKGREWTSVRLASDFPPRNRMGDSDRRLLYVAATRAQHLLDLSVCPPFLPSRERDSDVEIPPIRVVFTQPQPSAEELKLWLEAKGIEHVNKVETANLLANPQYYDDQKTNPVVVDQTKLPEFTWTKWSEEWCLRGPAGVAPGTCVTVTKKSGVASVETVGPAVKEFSDATIYQIK